MIACVFQGCVQDWHLGRPQSCSGGPKTREGRGGKWRSPETVGRSQPGGVDPSAAGELKARPPHKGGITAGRRRDDCIEVPFWTPSRAERAVAGGCQGGITAGRRETLQSGERQRKAHADVRQYTFRSMNVMFAHHAILIFLCLHCVKRDRHGMLFSKRGIMYSVCVSISTVHSSVCLS